MQMARKTAVNLSRRDDDDDDKMDEESEDSDDDDDDKIRAVSIQARIHIFVYSSMLNNEIRPFNIY